MNILLIGPLPPPIGGATVLFQQLVAELTAYPDIEIIVIRTNPNSSGKMKRLLHQILTIWRIATRTNRAEVVAFHASISGGFKLSPFVRLVCLVMGKPWIFRGFGGNYPNWYANSPIWKQYLFRVSAVQANVVLLETKASVSYFSPLNKKKRVEWYPNSRPFRRATSEREESKTTRTPPKAGAKRFVYLGHVQPSKGVLVLHAAAKTLATDVSIDVFGPLLEGLEEASLKGDRMRYRGVLAPDQVARTLNEYDALVFPTMYVGEGYPGVILEAYTCGLPVITTRFRSIPEIVDESSGILVEPGDSNELATAIESLAGDAELFARLRAGAQRKAKLFGSQEWTARFVKICAEIRFAPDT